MNEDENRGLGSILKPKSHDEIKKAALEIKDPNDLLYKAINTLGDPELVSAAMKRGADANKISSDITKVKNPEIIKVILTNSQTDISPNSLIYKATKMGLEDEIIDLIKDNKLDPGKKQSILLVWAVGFGREKLVKALLKDKRVKPENEKESVTEALSIAIARGNNDLVKLLIKDARVDPSADYNRPIKVASQFGNKEIVEILLKDKRVDPSAKDLSDNKDNFSIRSAALNNHINIVALLLKDPRVRKKLDNYELKTYEEMSKKIVRESLVQEETMMATPTTKPTVKPGVKPGTKRPPSPIRRERPSVTPGPKATAEDVAKKFLDLISED